MKNIKEKYILKIYIKNKHYLYKMWNEIYIKTFTFYMNKRKSIFKT